MNTDVEKAERGTYNVFLFLLHSCACREVDERTTRQSDGVEGSPPFGLLGEGHGHAAANGAGQSVDGGVTNCRSHM